MSAHEFSIPVTDLDAAGKHVRFPVRAAWMRGALEDHEATAAGPDGELDVRVSKSGNDVVVHGHLKAELTLPCARCLEPAKVTIDKAVSALMVPATSIKGSTGETDEYEFSAEEADTLPYDGDTVVLDDFVRDELVLETPMIPLCSEDCPGMSRPAENPVHGQGAEGQEAAIDPRLAPLLRFKKMHEKKENKE